ncbi:MAG TPA: cellulase family glycosylhydrolase [Solirubrobacteraceae bacterium]|jgi:hypothetical protein|nr:cellulase family glycosylhydrolase [Solirubrobacteraceae bacterium]
MRPITRSIILALFLGALLAPAAHASPLQTSIMMDDDLLLYKNDATAARALTQMKSLGVDTIRVTVLWSVVANNARPTKAEIAKLKGKAKDKARKQAQRFKATNPSTYPKQNWDRYDNLIKAAQDRGIRVYFNVTGPGPLWASTTPPKGLKVPIGTYKPKVGAFKQFVTAVGTRYSGTYQDENGSRGTLPRVSMWSLWNEPNQGGWLTPQWEQRGGQTVPASPAIYRKLYQAGYQGLVASGHRVDNDVILLGETAPLGNDAQTAKSPMRPKQFLRELFCVGPDGNPYSGAAAAARDCGDFASKGPLRATGYAHHPYTKNVSPLVPDANPDALTMANITDLGTTLDDLAAKTNDLPSGLPLFMTEFGFETNPPDPFSGIAPALQAKYNVLGEFQAYSNPRIASQAQFLLADVPPIRTRKKGSKGYWFTYQSGLFFTAGKLIGTAKPAAYSYAMPFLATPIAIDPATGNPTFSFWGQLRLLPNGLPGAAATIQFRPKDGSLDWTAVGPPIAIDPATDPMGYYTATATAPVIGPVEWRAAVINPADGSLISSSPGTDGT